jgi:dipeptidyl peptidase IV (DPP IV)-like protein
LESSLRIQIKAAVASRVRWWMAGLTAAAMAGLLVTGPAASALAAYPGADGLIAFVRNGDIYSVNPESATPGSTVSRLTSDGRDSGPRWSPSGKQLAYLDRGNLWVMDANGSHKRRITDQSPAYTDARPSWSPNGRYLAFVKTRRGARYGYLTRYDTVTRKFATFSMPYHSERPTRRQVAVTALAAPVAWGRALNATGTTFGSFIIFEGATAPACPGSRYCLDALGYRSQPDYKNGFPSSDIQTKKPLRRLDPDWYPNSPLFSVDVLTTQEKCSSGHCGDTGIDTTIGAAPILPGAYQAVYSPAGVYLAYVRNVRGRAEIFIYSPPGVVPARSTALTTGTEPDWQPLAVRPAG